MRTVLVIVAAILLSGCGDSRRIPSSAPKPSLKVWVYATGKSMLPHYPERAFILAEIGIPYDELREGDTVVFWDYRRGERAFTHHRLIQKQGDSWIAKGDNPETNPIADNSWVTRDNYYMRTTAIWSASLLIPAP